MINHAFFFASQASAEKGKATGRKQRNKRATKMISPVLNIVWNILDKGHKSTEIFI